jgi:hypothetical protein
LAVLSWGIIPSTDSPAESVQTSGREASLS